MLLHLLWLRLLGALPRSVYIDLEVCEKLNNSAQISAAAATAGRPLTRYTANSRSNGAARSGWRGREFGDQGWRRIEFRDQCGRIREFEDQRWRMREFGDQGAENERVETWRVEQECRVQKEITELHRTLDSAVNFGPGEDGPHLGSGAAHRRATCITGTSRTAALGRTSVGSGA